LPAVIGLNAVARQQQRGDGIAAALRRRPVDLARRNPQLLRVKRDAVEPLGQFEQSGITACRHVGDDGAHRLLDIGGGFPLGGEKGGEPAGEVGGARVEADRHR
jgi:hypothetical protein